MKILLASASPRRKQLLTELGYEVEVVRPTFDEDTVTASDPAALVAALAEGKGRSVLPQKEALLVAADTVVVFEGRVLGKPCDEQEAHRILSALSGRRHEVYTGVYLQRDGISRTFTERAEVFFRPLTEQEIRDYIATGSPMDKAGAYGIQDSGFVDRIEGSYHNVMGFPTEKFEEIIKEF
ncbi:MAG: septum formation protein Maf [Clostridia bacterium]|nr:septum formation protein Maf [Clostridia bacterium]